MEIVHFLLFCMSGQEKMQGMIIETGKTSWRLSRNVYMQQFSSKNTCYEHCWIAYEGSHNNVVYKQTLSAITLSIEQSGIIRRKGSSTEEGSHLEEHSA